MNCIILGGGWTGQRKDVCPLGDIFPPPPKHPLMTSSREWDNDDDDGKTFVNLFIPRVIVIIIVATLSQRKDIPFIVSVRGLQMRNFLLMGNGYCYSQSRRGRKEIKATLLSFHLHPRLVESSADKNGYCEWVDCRISGGHPLGVIW